MSIRKKNGIVYQMKTIAENTNRKHKIAVITNGWSSEFLSMALEGVRAEAQKDLSDLFVFVTFNLSGGSPGQSRNQMQIMDLIRPEEYDGIILDWMMPKEDGVSALRRMRGQGIGAPCLLLTARDAVGDRVAGLDAGADDYLPKPFDAQELLARVRAMLRRREAFVPDVVSFGDLTLDKGSYELRRGPRSVRLTGKLYQLMLLFMENPRQLFSVQQLMDRVWNWDSEAEINVVWVNISQLRKKLAELETTVEIRVHRGTGYSLELKS